MDVKALIAQKQSKKENKNLSLNDINHDLIVSLFAVSVYGKPARDEDILTIIIGGPKKADPFKYTFDKIKARYERQMKDSSLGIVKKSGAILDKDGFIILQPR